MTLISETSYIDSLPEPRRYYPVKLTATNVYVVWVEADSQDHAVKRANSDPSDLIYKEAAIEGWITGEAPDEWDDNLFDYDPVPGPLQACGECGAIEDEPGKMRWAHHAGDCSQHIHRVDLTWVYGDNRGTTVGYLARCSCQQGEFAAPFRCDVDQVPDGLTVHPDRQTAGDLLREHVAGRFHSKNVPLGITDDQY